MRTRKFESALGTGEVPKGYKTCGCSICIGIPPLGEAKLIAKSTWYHHYAGEQAKQQQGANVGGSQVVSGLGTSNVQTDPDLEAQVHTSQNLADQSAMQGIQSV